MTQEHGAAEWAQFAQTGSVYDYLNYKLQQARDKEGRAPMQISTSGLVLRQVKVGEADQILTILTPDRGVLSASARGSLRLKSKLFSGCGLFCYSEFTLTTGRASNFVDAAAVKKVFHGLGRSVEGMALAAYLAEALTVLSPEPPEAETAAAPDPQQPVYDQRGQTSAAADQSDFRDARHEPVRLHAAHLGL